MGTIRRTSQFVPVLSCATLDISSGEVYQWDRAVEVKILVPKDQPTDKIRADAQRRNGAVGRDTSSHF